ncbi:MAG: dihydrolipoyl dehydrogenase [Dehalococcoidia bacterium]
MVIGQTGERVDMVVIGGGPGGYSAAIRSAQLGQKVVLIERAAIGGVCLNHGCVPSKALLSAAQLADRARRGAAMGIDARVDVDLVRLQAWKRGIVDRLTTGVRGLLDRWGIRVVHGAARLASERRVAVDLGEDVAFFEFQSAVLATGSRAATAGGLSPEQALELDALPARIVVAGAGSVGVELATAFARLGQDVTLLSPDGVLLPELDEPLLGRAVAGGLRRLGVTLVLSCTIERIESTSLSYRTKDGPAQIDDVLVVDASRRVPNTDDLGLADAGLRLLEDGTVRVDTQQRTTMHHIFAVGDITPGPLLAHRAIAEGRVAAEVAAGLASAMDPSVIPVVCFTEPEVAAVGLSESAARGQGHAVSSARFPFAASGRALTLEEPEGFLQVVSDLDSGRLTGVQIAGTGATELAGEAALAIEMGATLDDLALTLHPHPTIGEAFVETAELALGRPRHIFRTPPPRDDRAR